MPVYLMKYPNNTLILTREPFVGFMPADVRSWLQDHGDDRNLATAFAEVSNKTGCLGHELGETDDPWITYAYEEWRELYQEIHRQVLAAIGRENMDRFNPGGYRFAEPFMEKNGYRDGSGWWIPIEK